MANITSVKAIQILDSRGLPTVSCRVETDDGLSAISKVPSGASTGEREALELRDGGNEYLGKGVLRAVKNINTKLADVLIGMDARNQFEIDQALIDLDGTPAKKNLGANAILAASIATLISGAKSAKLPLYEHVNNLYCSKFKANKQLSLPTPMLNIINGGEHANNNIDIQEFMVMPIGAGSFNECMQWAIEIYGALKSLLASKGLSTAVGDEGGFAPDLKSNHEAIELILKSIEDCGLEAGKDIVLALDTNHLDKVDLNRADQIVTSRNKLFTHISKEKDRLQKIFPDVRLHTASTTGTINHILVEALESTGFYALAGYHAAGKDIGCPFDFFYPSDERHNFANQPQRSVVGIPTTDCLVEMVLEGRCHEYLERHLYNLNFGHQLNANSSLVFTADITRVANCVGSQLDLLTEFLARLSQKEIINIQPLGHLVDDFRTTNPTVTPPTCFLDQSRLFYYDDNCQLVFDSSQPSQLKSITIFHRQLAHLMEKNPKSHQLLISNLRVVD